MVFRTFAERKRLESLGSEPEVYVYDQAPAELRHQICLAFSEGIGRYVSVGPYDVSGISANAVIANQCWSKIDRICHKEIFAYRSYANGSVPSEGVLQALVAIKEVDLFLSIVEIGCVVMAETAEERHLHSSKREAALDAISEINERFEQHAIGYQFENGSIIRKDSRFIHSEIIKPTLSLLAEPVFEKINGEFIIAHEHYRQKRFKDAVTAANRAFEAMLKAFVILTNGNTARATEHRSLSLSLAEAGFLLTILTTAFHRISQ